MGRLEFRHHGWRRASQWECETKCRTTAGPIFSPDMPTVGRNNTTANRQTQSGTAGLSRSLHAIKLFKDALLITRRQSWPLVRNFDRHGAVRGPGREQKRTPGRRVFDGVVEQIDQHLFDQHTIEGYQGQVRG